MKVTAAVAALALVAASAEAVPVKLVTLNVYGNGQCTGSAVAPTTVFAAQDNACTNMGASFPQPGQTNQASWKVNCTAGTATAYPQQNCAGTALATLPLGTCLNSTLPAQLYSCQTLETDSLATFGGYSDATCQTLGAGFVAVNNQCASSALSTTTSVKYATTGANVTVTTFNGTTCAGAQLATSTAPKNVCYPAGTTILNGANVTVYAKITAGVPWVTAPTAAPSSGVAVQAAAAVSALVAGVAALVF